MAQVPLGSSLSTLVPSADGGARVRIERRDDSATDREGNIGSAG